MGAVIAMHKEPISDNLFINCQDLIDYFNITEIQLQYTVLNSKCFQFHSFTMPDVNEWCDIRQRILGNKLTYNMYINYNTPKYHGHYTAIRRIKYPERIPYISISNMYNASFQELKFKQVLNPQLPEDYLNMNIVHMNYVFDVVYKILNTMKHIYDTGIA